MRHCGRKLVIVVLALATTVVGGWPAKQAGTVVADNITARV